jgi:hypothetical protein
MADRSRRIPTAPRRSSLGQEVLLALIVNPDVFLVMALVVGLFVTGGIFFAFTSGWWPFIFTTLTGAIFSGTVVVLLRRQSHWQRRRR